MSNGSLALMRSRNQSIGFGDQTSQASLHEVQKVFEAEWVAMWADLRRILCDIGPEGLEECREALRHVWQIRLQSALERFESELAEDDSVDDVSEVVSTTEAGGRLPAEARSALLKVYSVKPKPSLQEKEWIAAKVGLSVKQVAVWFANKRARDSMPRRHPKSLKRLDKPQPCTTLHSFVPAEPAAVQDHLSSISTDPFDCSFLDSITVNSDDIQVLPVQQSCSLDDDWQALQSLFAQYENQELSLSLVA